jgi:signal transduction histidine kinase
VSATGGTRSLLFEHNPRNGIMQATSGFGLDELRTDPWHPDAGEAALVEGAFADGGPALIAGIDRQMPELAARLGTPAALLVPLRRSDVRVGLLAIGVDAAAAADPPASWRDAASEIADALLATLDLFRLRQNEELHRHLRDLLDDFSARLSESLDLAAGLDRFSHGVNRLFGADRTSVWIHDRRARRLVLQASSAPGDLERGAQVSVEEPLALAAAGMRRSRAEIAPAPPDAPTCTLTVPLRGCRRALGTIVFEGVRVEAGGELALLDRADELGRQLSGAIENLQLVDEVMQSRQELENVFDSIAHLVVVLDRSGRIVRANEPFALRAQVSRPELAERTLAEFVGPELAGWLASQTTGHGETGTRPPAIIEVTDPVLRGTFRVTVTDLLTTDPGRGGTVVVARDLTFSSKLEAEREELRRRLGQSEKLAALGQFVAGIAHELNNPLQGVLGHLELLRTTGAFPKHLRREIQTIYREADRAAKIVRNLLVFAGSRSRVRRLVNINTILQKVVGLRAAACAALDIEVVRHYGEKLPRVPSDPLLLHQVFLNMMMNAEQAMAATSGGGRIELGTREANGRVVATIRDTGPGIPADVLTHIFEPFYTTKEVGQGTGLGLAIAYGIVQEHGGQISAANHPEGGALFTVELPAGTLTP